jgi:hypothetical protein
MPFTEASVEMWGYQTNLIRVKCHMNHASYVSMSQSQCGPHLPHNFHLRKEALNLSLLLTPNLDVAFEISRTRVIEIAQHELKHTVGY